MSDNEEISRIKKDIEKSGLPLEIEVSSILNEKNWFTTHQMHYLDPDENKSRFIDIVAERWKETGSKKIKKVNQTLIIECKRSNKPWVFYTVPRKFLWVTWPRFISTPELYPKIMDFFAKHSHYFLGDPEEIANINYEPFTDKGEGKIFTAVNQVLKSLRYSINEMTKFFSKKTEIDRNRYMGVFIYYPVIVFDGKLYKCEKSKDDLKISPVNYIKYNVSYRGLKEMEESYLIYVVKKEFLTKYFKLLDDELKRILDYFHVHK